ncbi:MAG: CvpA family protein [Acidobacteriota bacterium]|nr:CvpA family protein [Acidobacteriota bacterium]
MSLFDWFLVAILVYSTVKAFIRGLILELFSFGGLVAAILLASWYYKHVAVFVGRVVTTPGTARIVAFFLILAGVMVLSALAGRLLNRTAHAIGLGFFDRMLGAVFGLARGCLFGVAILMAIAAFVPHADWTENSRLSSYFLAGAHAVSFVVPHDLQHEISKGAAELKHTAPDWIKRPG